MNYTPVCESVKPALAAAPCPPRPGLLTRAELAARLGISQGTIKLWYRKYGLPVIRNVQGVAFFSWVEVLEWLKRADTTAPEAGGARQ